MFSRLFRSRNHPLRVAGDALYATIVAAARQPALYARLGVPDTPTGRFEMMALHMILVLRSLALAGDAAAPLAQELTDTFFLEMDSSMRDLGIGDTRVPQRMKALAGVYFGRAKAYGDAIGQGDAVELAAAIARNVWPGMAAGDASGLAAYALEADRIVAASPKDDLGAGRLSWPALLDEEDTPA
ncbi:MAG: ubiquinol-cytochrome C chaperone family protein [Rhizobiaceae bacterium]